MNEISLGEFPFNQFTESIKEGECDFIFDDLTYSIANGSASRIESSIKYSFDFDNRLTELESCIVICSKGIPDVFLYTIAKIKKHNVGESSDILIIEDRPTNPNLRQLCEDNKFSYLSIKNSKDVFNYSMLNNIAASFCGINNKKTLSFWNNDMWPEEDLAYPESLKKHLSNGNCITGIRLLYPSSEQYLESTKTNGHVLQEDLKKAFSTIQHAGIQFQRLKVCFSDSLFAPMPYHSNRFMKPDIPDALKNRECDCVTGALHIVDLDLFIKKLKGYSMFLKSSYQDIDLCLRARINNLKVYYVGEHKMTHAESVTIHSENNLTCPSRESDFLLYQIKWADKHF